MANRSRLILAQMVVAPIGGLALLVGFIPAMATSPLVFFMFGIAVMGVLLVVVSMVREGRKPLVAIAVPIGTALFTFALIFGIMRYFMSGQLEFNPFAPD